MVDLAIFCKVLFNRYISFVEATSCGRRNIDKSMPHCRFHVDIFTIFTPHTAEAGPAALLTRMPLILGTVVLVEEECACYWSSPAHMPLKKVCPLIRVRQVMFALPALSFSVVLCAASRLGASTHRMLHRTGLCRHLLSCSAGAAGVFQQSLRVL